jgi:hypothetical protein
VVNDVKYLCEQLLDDAPPPLRDSAEVLARARRSTARRSAARATGGALAVAAVTGAVLVAIPAAITVSRTPLATGPAAPTDKATVKAPVKAPVEVPWAQAAGTHDKKMLAAILKALPAGYTGTLQYPLSTSTTPYPTDPSAPLPGGAAAMMLTNVDVLVGQDGRVGWLAASMINDGKPTPADLCGTTANCQVVDVNGVQIKLTHEHWDNTAPEIDVVVATRYLRNGQLSIVESRSVPDFQSEKSTPLPPDAVTKHPQRQAPTSALGDWFLTDQQLAELIASPAMLP